MKRTSAAAPLFLVAGLMGIQTTSAHAATTKVVDVMVDPLRGTGLIDGTDQPLFDAQSLWLLPGASTTATMLVANQGSSAGRLGLQAVGVVNHENGCTEPEGDVDASCSADEGEMSDALVVKAFIDRTGKLAFPTEPAWAGPFRDFAVGTNVRAGMAAGEIWGVRLELALPLTAGNEVQSDEVGFALAVSLTETDPAPEVLGETLVQPAAGEGTSDRAVVGKLPRTGLPFGPLAASGGALVVIGAVLRTAMRRRRRRTAS